MNQFIFFVHASDRVWFGTLKAQSGDHCKELVKQWLAESGIAEDSVVRIELKGVTSKTFDVQEASL